MIKTKLNNCPDLDPKILEGLHNMNPVVIKDLKHKSYPEGAFDVEVVLSNGKKVRLRFRKTPNGQWKLLEILV